MKNIYIILSHSGTIMSRIVRLYTRYKYSHVSISLDKNMTKMYSFGRKKVYNPFNGGFTVESKDGIFYRTFKNTKCSIIELSITKEQYNNLKKILDSYNENKDVYKYDIIGVILRAVNIKVNRKNYFYCTKFIKEVLEDSDIYHFEEDFVKPKYFMELPNIKIIYTGKLSSYS